MRSVSGGSGEWVHVLGRGVLGSVWCVASVSRSTSERVPVFFVVCTDIHACSICFDELDDLIDICQREFIGLEETLRRAVWIF